MQTPKFHRNLYFGLVLHGNKIWLSEFLGLGFVAVVSSALIAITVVILHNSFMLNRQGADIVAKRTEQVTLAWQLDELRAEDRLVQSLRAVIGNSAPADEVYRLVSLVYLNSKYFGYDPLLVLAVIQVESLFDRGAQGQYLSGVASGALGLMQLKFETAQEVARSLGIQLTKKEDLFKPEINIPIGIAYLTQQISLFKSFKLGLLAYNQGPGVVIQNLAENKPLEVDYFNRILKNYFRLRKISDGR
jgi:soluble lytic murein transglycosylase-like protein